MVTGGNSGIGKVTVRELARLGATVVLVARDEERGGKALAKIRAGQADADVRLMLCDLSAQASVREFAGRFRDAFDRLDILVNNAGVYLARRRTSADGLELTLATNHLGYFQLTALLIDMLLDSAPARIVNVSSGAHHGHSVNFDDLAREKRYWGYSVYGETKLMNILFTRALARRLEGMGVTANALHPGFVRTNFARNNFGPLGKVFVPMAQLFGRSEEHGAETVIYLAASPEVEGVSGEYFVDSRIARTSAAATDVAAQERLWSVSERLARTAFVIPNGAADQAAGA
jgi:NAD(P)-dependent dehydrogenase (short-subunit alcohol dehydrogenase family)